MLFRSEKVDNDFSLTTLRDYQLHVFDISPLVESCKMRICLKPSKCHESPINS